MDLADSKVEAASEGLTLFKSWYIGQTYFMRPTELIHRAALGYMSSQFDSTGARVEAKQYFAVLAPTKAIKSINIHNEGVMQRFQGIKEDDKLVGTPSFNVLFAKIRAVTCFLPTATKSVTTID